MRVAHNFRRKICQIFCFLIILLCLGSTLEIATQEECSVIMPEGRADCRPSSTSGRPNNEKDCLLSGCCWNENSSLCYEFSNCRTGYYGWRCHLRCNCPRSGECNRHTGACDAPCNQGYWGVGCLLDNNCTYNDHLAKHYTGSRQYTDSNLTCQYWSIQKSYELSEFPDKLATSLHSISNYCRNPKGSRGAFCYTSRYHWDSCTLASCVCPKGRYGPSCVQECHCDDLDEACDPDTGECRASGCHQRWSGSDCSECADGYFGQHCEYDCKCHSPNEVCDKHHGTCDNGCAPGWQGVSCRQECEDKWFGFNCDFSCNCRAQEEVCNKATGACSSGCKEGFGGEGCLTELPYLSRAPLVRNRNATSITINWREWTQSRDKGTGPVGRYQVFFRPSGKEDWIVVANEVNSKLITVTDLSQESWYEFQITPVHVTGLSGLPSPILNASTCGRPTSGILKMRLSLKTEREETLSASWEPPKREHVRCISISGYNVYLTNSSNHSSLSLHDFVRTNSAHIRNIDVYQNLTVAITTVNNAGLESNPVFQTYTGRSGAVENLEAEAVNGSTILLTWTPPKLSNGVIDSYLLTYRLVLPGKCKKRFSSSRQEQWTPFIDIDGAQNQMEISGLSVYSFYKFRIYPRTPSGKGKEEEVTGNTQATEPVANLSLKLITINSKSAVVAWDAVDCQNYNGEFVGYMYELYAHNAYGTFPSAEILANESSVNGQLYLSGVVNQTELVLNQLIPYLNYTLCIWFANHQYYGPKSMTALETHEDAPPAPKNVMVESKTSESLLVTWARPDPPQGLITRYSLRYFAVQNTRSASTTVTLEDVDVLSYNITKLVPFGHYGLQVRASTRIGDGPWSELVEEHTDETVPTQPLDLTNTSRSSKDVSLQWKAPVNANGVIRFYSVTCSSANPLYKEKVPPVEKVVSPPSLNLTVDNLMPGINYVCKVSASTKKGEGPPAWYILWTEPEISFDMPAPVLKQSQATDNLIIVDLLPSEPIDYMDEPDSLYRVVVEILPDMPFERTKRGASRAPCDLGNSDLVDRSLATARGLRCYIAAEIPRIVKTRTFIVGDNKTYGGYYNAMLSPDSDHDVWFGLVVTVDGVTVSSYAKTDQPNRVHVNKNYRIKTTVIQKEQSESLTSLTPATGAVVGSLAAIALLAVLIILLLYKILQRRRKDASPSSVVMFDSTSDSISEQNAKLLPVEPPESPKKIFDPIPVSQLWDHVVPMRQSDYENLRAEFNEFRKEPKFVTDVAKKPENKAKNRYQNIYPYDHSRVILDCSSNEPNSDYINANYIDGYKGYGAFVAAQGPLENTVDDMWRMLWQLNSRIIIMVTNLQEGGRHKCKQYWPDAGIQHYGDIQVEMQNSEEYADYAIRTFLVSKKGEKRSVKQFHFTTWPDHGIPEHPTSLIEFRKKVRSYADDVQQKDPDCGPCLVHCSAGVGRTGCYIALDYSLDMAKQEGFVDVFNFVKKMRNDRVSMIQTPEQYIFVYEALLEALQAGVTSIPCSEFRSRYAKLSAINPETEKSYLLEEYELLESTNLLYNQDDKNLEQEYKKNQNGKGTKSHLKTSKDVSAAIFVDGYKHRKAFVVTTSPKDASNFNEFWSDVSEHQCGAIICLEDQNHKDHHEVTYFPTSTVESLDFNSFSVKLISSDYSPYFDQQEFLIYHNSKLNRSSKELRVRRFKLKSWTLSYDKVGGKISLPTRSSVLALLGALEKWQQYNGNSVVLVHCRDAATHSGIFCAGSFLIEKLKIEHEVDVFSSIRHIRVNRPQFVPNLVQYQYLYDLAIDYLDCFDTYANFESSI